MMKSSNLSFSIVENWLLLNQTQLYLAKNQLNLDMNDVRGDLCDDVNKALTDKEVVEAVVATGQLENRGNTFMEKF